MNIKSRPIWYVFSGIGSHWAGLARDLLKLEKFRVLANRVADILKTENFDMMRILTSPDKSIMDNVLNCVISITATQVPIYNLLCHEIPVRIRISTYKFSFQLILVDLLKELGIVPDGMIGHSLGEIGCAYADGTLTLEEAIRISYWRGKCLLDSNLPKKGMAVVGKF